MSTRLNPKLTRRLPASALEFTSRSIKSAQSGDGANDVEETPRSGFGSELSGSSDASSYSTTGETVTTMGDHPLQNLPINPRLHLIHNLQWVPKQVSFTCAFLLPCIKFAFDTV